MIIRPVEACDLDAISDLCMASFLHSVAATLSAEGVATFSKIALSEACLARMSGDNVMLVAQNDGTLEGFIELKAGHHIAMLFVRPECQRQGVGRQLLLSALSYAKDETVTVRASLPSVTAYERYGFQCQGDVAVFAGLTYQLMVLSITELSIKALSIPELSI